MPPSMRPQIGARTRGFFDNFTLPEQQSEPQQARSAPARDTTLSQPGSGSGSGVPLDVYGQGSPNAQRDVYFDKMDSITGLRDAHNQANAGVIGGLAQAFVPGLSTANTLSSALGGPSMPGFKDAFQGIQKSNELFTGWQQANPTQSGLQPGQYASWGDLFGGITMGDRASRIADLEATSLAEAQAAAEVPGPTEADVQAAIDTDSGISYSPDSSPASGGFGSSPGYDSGGPGDGTSADFADGGVVGLTGPMLNQAPQNLTQMGFADGGPVGMGGNVGPEQLQQQINQFVRNPQFKQVAQQAVGNAMASGELTPEELVTLGRIAEAAMHNPGLYPQLRQFASQNGLTPLPPSYDPRLVVVLIAASKIFGGGQNGTPAGQVPPMDQAQMQNPTGMANGGFLRGPGTGRSDSIGTVEESTGKPVKVANGEYVIPAHVVSAKGKDFFDKMLRQYAQLTPQE